MASTVVARRYARALFEASRDAGKLDLVVSELERFATVLESSPELQGILSTPALPLDDRQGLLRALLERAKANRLTTNALLLLTELGRLTALTEITEAFLDEADRAAGRVRAKVTSAAELSPGQVKDVKAAL